MECVGNSRKKKDSRKCPSVKVVVGGEGGGDDEEERRSEEGKKGKKSRNRNREPSGDRPAATYKVRSNKWYDRV